MTVYVCVYMYIVQYSIDYLAAVKLIMTFNFFFLFSFYFYS